MERESWAEKLNKDSKDVGNLQKTAPNKRCLSLLSDMGECFTLESWQFQNLCQYSIMMIMLTITLYNKIHCEVKKKKVFLLKLLQPFSLSFCGGWKIIFIVTRMTDLIIHKNQYLIYAAVYIFQREGNNFVQK